MKNHEIEKFVPLKTKQIKGKPIVKHLLREGSRYHVVSYDTNGRHCNIENCEINYPEKEG